jgi:protein TonB
VGGDPNIIPPRVVRRVQPEYPLQAIKEGREGRVLLRLLVDEMGQLLDIKPILGDRMLTKAAVKAVEQWQFEPRLINGRPEHGFITVALEFKLEKNQNQ